MLLSKRLANSDDVHDRENAGALIVGHLFRLAVGEQAGHTRVVSEKRLDEIGMEDRVELALGQHGLDRLVIRQA